MITAKHCPGVDAAALGPAAAGAMPLGDRERLRHGEADRRRHRDALGDAVLQHVETGGGGGQLDGDVRRPRVKALRHREHARRGRRPAPGSPARRRSRTDGPARSEDRAAACSAACATATSVSASACCFGRQARGRALDRSRAATRSRIALERRGDQHRIGRDADRAALQAAGRAPPGRRSRATTASPCSRPTQLQVRRLHVTLSLDYQLDR